MSRLIVPVLLALILLPNLLSAQMTVVNSGEVTAVTRIVPGVVRADGLTTPGRLLRYHITTSDYLPGGIMIKTRSYLPETKDGLLLAGEIGAILRPLGVTSVRSPFPKLRGAAAASVDPHGLGRIYEIRFTAGENIPELCARLDRLAEVEYAEPMIARRPTVTPNDPRIGEQYGLDRVEAAAAWDISKGDSSVLIAIVDGGVDWKHEDLAGNIWTNPNEVPNNGIDDDNNGKIDDVHGWDFVGNVSVIQILGGLFLEDNDPGLMQGATPASGMNHGTHCAGVAGAVANNGIGIAGLAYNVRLLPVKVATDDAGEDADEQFYRAYEGIYYAASLGADIISCSWGGGIPSLVEADVINQATDMGSLVIAAAGNDGLNIDNYLHYPSSFPNVLAVGASDQQDGPASFSNYGIGARVFAPGVNILSSIAGDNRYSGSYSGTSMATPLVSGLAALIKSVHPDWTVGEIAHQLRSTVDNVVVSDPLQRPGYFGRINARRALEVNSSETEGERMPGVEIVESGVDAVGGVIVDTSSRLVSLTLRNYLAPVSNLNVKITPLGEDVEVIGGAMTIDSMGRFDEADLELQVRILDNPSWYEGVAQLLVSYDAPGYHDVELLQIPYQFESETNFTLMASGLPARTSVSGGHSPSYGVLWGVGEVPGVGGGFVRISGTEFNYDIISIQTVTSVYAFDEARAVATSGPVVMKTTDRGMTWSNVLVADITTQAQNVHFFDGTSGVLLGSPLNGDKGIGLTTDAGETWEPLTTQIPVAAGDESIRPAIAWAGDHGWFATNAESLYHTGDRGKTWERWEMAQSNTLLLLAFRTPEVGLGVTRKITQDGLVYQVLGTTDGGKTWENTGAPLTIEDIVPVHLTPIPDHNAFVLLGSDGRVKISSDDGLTWQGKATSRTNAFISGGTSYSNIDRARIWSLGTSIGVLDIPFEASSVPEIAGERDSPMQILSVFPNPVNSGNEVALSIHLEESATMTIELVDLTGRVVLRHEAGRMASGTHSLNLALGNLASGQYICRVEGDQRVRSRVVRVER